VEGCLNWQGGMRSRRFKAVWMVVLIVGIIFSSIGFKPIEIIKFAQIANGLLLPVIAVILLWIMNKTSVLGNFKNTTFQNVLALLILFVTIFLGLKSILKVFELI
jgi:Mn2+/Fe2+ NRAMP family transporter